MAHYAFLDKDNTVVEVIVGVDETQLIEGEHPEYWYGQLRGMTCKRTSYNGNIRGVFAGIGYKYNSLLDVFYDPRPTLNLPSSMPE